MESKQKAARTISRHLVAAIALAASAASLSAGVDFMPETGSPKIEAPMGEICGMPVFLRWTKPSGWQCSIDASMKQESTGNIAVNSQCLKYVFIPEGEGRFICSPEGAPGSLVVSNGDFLFTGMEGVSLRFGRDARLKSVQSPVYGSCKVELDGAGRIVSWRNESGGISSGSIDLGSSSSLSSSSSDGRAEWDSKDSIPRRIFYGKDCYTIKVKDALPSEIASSEGQSWRIAYDNSGRVSGFSGELHDYAFIYGEDGRLSAMTDSKGSNVCYSHSPISGEVPGMTAKAQDLNTGAWTRWTFTPGSCLQEDFDKGSHLARRIHSNLLTAETRIDMADGSSIESSPLPDGSTRTLAMIPGKAPTVTVSDASGSVSLSLDGDELFRQQSVFKQTEATPGSFKGRNGILTMPDGRPLHLIVSGDSAASCRYDDNGWLSSVSLPGGGTSHFKYDKDGRLLSVMSPDGAETSLVYDKAKGTVLTKFPDGSEELRHYDGMARLSRVTQPSGRETAFVYGEANGGSALRLEGFESKTWRILAAFSMASSDLSGLWSFTRADDSPSCVFRNSPDGVSLRYSYDDQGRLRTISDSKGVALASFKLDRNGLPLAAGSASSTIAIDRDEFGRELSRTLASPDYSISTSYASGGRIKSLSDSAGETLSMSGGSPSKSASAESSSAGAFKIEYGAAGMPVSITRPNAVRTAWLYDEASRLKEIRHILPLGQRTVVRAFKYDCMGRICEISDPDSGRASISYDLLSRPVSTESPSGRLEQSFDGWGNLLKRGADAVTYSRPGCPASLGSRAYSCDKFARLDSIPSDAGAVKLSYDWDWRLSSAMLPGGKSCEWSYDAFSNICGFKDAGGGTTLIFSSPGGSMLSCIDADSGGLTRYLFMPGFRDCLAITRPDGSVQYPLCDHEGTIVALTDSQGKLVAARSFTLDGLPASKDNLRIILGWRNSLSFLGGRIILYNGALALPELSRNLASPSLQPGDNGLDARNTLSMFDSVPEDLSASLSKIRRQP